MDFHVTIGVGVIVNWLCFKKINRHFNVVRDYVLNNQRPLFLKKISFLFLNDPVKKKKKSFVTYKTHFSQILFIKEMDLGIISKLTFCEILWVLVQSRRWRRKWGCLNFEKQRHQPQLGKKEFFQVRALKQLFECTKVWICIKTHN